MQLFVCCELSLVFCDLGDCAHGAFFQAVATADARILVDGIGSATDNLKNANLAASRFDEMNRNMAHMANNTDEIASCAQYCAECDAFAA